MIFDQFDRVRIVNLPHRRDRRNQMNRQLAKVGLLGDSRVSYQRAYQFSDALNFRTAGSRGCFTTHREIITEAAEQGQSVLIFEDDCDFTPAAKNYRLEGPWDVFYGGYTASDPANPHNSDIIGSHFIGLSAAATKKAAVYFARYPDPDFAPDPRAASEPGFNPAVRPGTDGAYVWFRRAHPELVTVFAQIGVQRPSRTDIGRVKWFDRMPIVRSAAEWTRRFKGPSSGTGYVFR
jgi:glycosyl transferase family 25